MFSLDCDLHYVYVDEKKFLDYYIMKRDYLTFVSTNIPENKDSKSQILAMNGYYGRLVEAVDNSVTFK